jgi:hypothetical protein
MALPLATPLQVQAGDIVDVSFQYRTGGSIDSLQNSMEARVRSHQKRAVKHLVLAVG